MKNTDFSDISLKSNIQNGAFPIHTNDLVCVYFEDERVLFEDDGGRKARKIFGDFEKDAAKEEAFMKMKNWIKVRFCLPNFICICHKL